jgi:hypothetical protein
MKKHKIKNRSQKKSQSCVPLMMQLHSGAEYFGNVIFQYSKIMGA